MFSWFLPMFVYTDRRALSAHLLATLVVQYEFNWMHMHNEANQGQHSRGQYTQMITVPCVESNGGKKTSANSQPHRHSIQWKRTKRLEIVPVPTANHSAALRRCDALTFPESGESRAELETYSKHVRSEVGSRVHLEKNVSTLNIHKCVLTYFS